MCRSRKRFVDTRGGSSEYGGADTLEGRGQQEAHTGTLGLQNRTRGREGGGRGGGVEREGGGKSERLVY